MDRLSKIVGIGSKGERWRWGDGGGDGRDGWIGWGGGDQERIAIEGGVFSRDSMSIRVDTLPVAG